MSHVVPTPRRKGKLPWIMLAFLAVGSLGASGLQPAIADVETGDLWHRFAFFSDPTYSTVERVALVLNVVIALAGLLYAYMLSKQIFAAESGTPRMIEIAGAIREGANAYLGRQFRAILPLIGLITVVLIATKWPYTLAADDPTRPEAVEIAIGRGIAFLFGAFASGFVGFAGMRLATAGNLRVAAAARTGFGQAFQLGFRTGTVTGMLTDGLGLLGGSLIFLYFGEKAYEALLGFGFGGTLLALFMRVGGGIYTKAADVGADLVGKIEANIPEDDPRNAATIADNVGDNVGDCAGMAADVFESYEVTIVAAMILGYASFGHKGVIFPLLVRAIGVIASSISTYSVRGGAFGDAASAMKAINRGFRLGALISVIGFMGLGAAYLNFDDPYVIRQALGRGLADEAGVRKALATEGGVKADAALAGGAETTVRFYRSLTAGTQEKIAAIKIKPAGWGDKEATIGELARTIVPLKAWDMRPAWACFVGIVLALLLMFCTEYWTSTEHEPVKSLARSCKTGHATNIIQGIAVGYESSVWAVIIIAAAIMASVLIYAGTTPLFVAYGVAMCGIGMLTLTGDTLSMDVFGPVADNANGIGEMGYNKAPDGSDLQPGQPDYLPPAEMKAARQILADLDATGNTTKAITKGVAIGSAVIAAVSLFASFIAVIATGSEEKINEMTSAQFHQTSAKLTFAEPMVFVGMLIGGAVPLLFSSMTIRAVGRAAFLIVEECRAQFRDKEIWAGTKRPDYGRVVDICTSMAQKELVGPGMLAIATPIFVGFLLGPYALGGFLAGMILVGQLLAVFMSNAGGAWDNAKKMIEDQPRTETTGKGSPVHMAAVTGDTVGDPLKDTAGPAINPLIKVMNMVSLLILPLVIAHNVSDPASKGYMVGAAVLAVSLLGIAWAWWQSKREDVGESTTG